MVTPQPQSSTAPGQITVFVSGRQKVTSTNPNVRIETINSTKLALQMEETKKSAKAVREEKVKQKSKKDKANIGGRK